MNSQAPPGEVLSAEDWAFYEAYFEGRNTDVAGPPEPTAAEVVDDGLRVAEFGVSALLDQLPAAAARLAPGEIVAALERPEVLRRRLPAVEHLLLAQVAQRSIHDNYAEPSPARLLVRQLSITPAEARARIRAAEVLGPRTSATGASLAPVLELSAEAQSLGQMSEAHVAVIRKAMRLLPPDLDPAGRDEVELRLVGDAVGMDPDDLAHVARRVVDLLDPDGREPAADRARRLRDVSLGRRADGSGWIRGDLTHELLASVRAVLDPLSAPIPEADGVKDTRTPGQRRHDGLLTLCRMTLRSGDLPDCGGVPATILVRVDVDDLVARVGCAQTAHGGAWPIRDMLDSIGDQAQWATVYGSKTDGTLAYGVDRRFASPGQTLALIARDGGCCFPGCDIPAAWSERHHVIPVVPVHDGDPPGRTDVDNLALVCGYHHRTFTAAGWVCRMVDGRPHWIPPAWIDPDRTPRRNDRWDMPTFPRKLTCQP